jgi:Zn-dependent protease with chaperone function
MLRKRFFSTLVLTALLTAPACAARKPGDPLRPGFNMFSKEQDIQLGREAAQQVVQQYPVVQNQALQDYLRRIGDRLAGSTDARQSGFPFTFTMLNQPEINAFALPGGPMFVFTGTLNGSDNEAQLAGVMAHEMAHVILRHGTNQVSKANLIQLPAMLAGAAVGDGSIVGQLAQLGIGIGANSILLKYSRDAETQADAMGARILAETGYNPIEMARFFEKLEAAGGSRGPQFLASHPDPGNRQRAIEAEIRTFPQRNYGFATGQFQQAKAQLGSLPAPQQRGTASRNAQPPQGAPSAGGWQELRGQKFSLNYPANWQVFGDQNSSSFTIAPREGLVQGSSGGTQVGYGAVVSYYFPERRMNLRNATDALVQRLRAENPNMQVVSRNQRRLTVGGSSGIVTMLESSSPYGGAETDALLTVSRPEGVFYMVFVAPRQNFSELEGAFEQMLNSIRFNN